jgi:hypothetical protein
VDVGLIVLYAIASATLSFFGGALPIWSLLAGAILGAAVGVLQGRSLRSSGAAFRATASMGDVRQALVSSKPGQTAVRLQWVGAAALVATAVLTPTPFRAFLAGYFLFMGVRDAIALPELISLDR